MPVRSSGVRRRMNKSNRFLPTGPTRSRANRNTDKTCADRNESACTPCIAEASTYARGSRPKKAAPRASGSADRRFQQARICRACAILWVPRSRNRSKDCRNFAEVHAAVSVNERMPCAADLALAALTAQLAYGLDDEKHPERSGMEIRQTAARGVERDVAARAKIGTLDECSALAFFAEADVFEHDEQLARKRVVDLVHVDIVEREPGAFERARRGDRRTAGRDVFFLRDRAVCVRVSCAEKCNRRFLQLGRTLERRHHVCTARIGNEARVEPVNGLDDGRSREHFFDRNRLAANRFRIERGPAAALDNELCELRARRSVLKHVPLRNERIGADGKTRP